MCRSCEQLRVETRCPLDPDAVDALYPGDLNRMFERIVTDPAYRQYQPVVLSRPSYAPGDTAENVTYAIGLWMVLFENAMTDDEADRLVELGGLAGYERSSDVGEELPDGTYTQNVNSGRTSTNAVRPRLHAGRRPYLVTTICSNPMHCQLSTHCLLLCVPAVVHQ